MLEQIAIIDKIRGKKIFVIGDMVADIYLDGKISRISREAPVLVLEQHSEKIVAGGAANVANNVATLGGKAIAAGLVGDDEGADGLRKILQGNGADVSGFFTDNSRPTISKTRVIASGRATVSQQIVRIDKESREPMSEECERRFIEYIKNVLPVIDGIAMSDYGAGTITEKIKALLIEWGRSNAVPIIVDSRYDILRFKGAHYVKQNDAELAAAVNLGREFADDGELRAAGRKLMTDMDSDGLLITRGEKGMTLMLKSGGVFDIPVADKSEVYDVSGAGDTCVATVILGLAAGVAPEHAAALSNIASGLAVRKLGTATVGSDELRRAVSKQNK